MTQDTPIATPSGNKQISQIKKGEEVLTASAHMVNGKLELAWEVAKVALSEGTGPDGRHPSLVSITIGNSFERERRNLIFTMDQPLLLASGKYTTAGKLHPDHLLINKEGEHVPITGIAIGWYRGGVNGIATSVPRTDIPDRHLLLAGGVVVGDFLMQLHFDQLPDSLKEIS